MAILPDFPRTRSIHIILYQSEDRTNKIAQNRSIMRVKKSFIARNWKVISVVSACLLTVTPSVAPAQTAGDVMTKMSVEQRLSYIAGVLEGLAFARWIKDKPDKAGMKCIYDWYYRDAKKVHTGVTAWLSRHPDKLVGGLMYVLIKRECGA